MSIRFACENPECGKAYTVKDKYAGMRSRCPACNHRVAVPAQGIVSTAPFPAPSRPDSEGYGPILKPTDLQRCAKPAWLWFAAVGGALFVLGGCLTAFFLLPARKPDTNTVATVLEPRPKQAEPIPAPPPEAEQKEAPKAEQKEAPKPSKKLVLKPSPPQSKKSKPPASSRPPTDYEKLKESVAVVQGKRGHGSGFVVLPSVIATNSHVIRDDFMKDITVRFIDSIGVEEVRPARLLYEDKARDLALLLLERDAKQLPLQINARFAAGKGKEVTVIGNPAQAAAGLAAVNVIGKGSTDSIVMLSGKPFIQVRIPPSKEGITVGPGNSGGPVFDHAGAVIGVLTAGLTRDGKPLEQHFCVPGHEVKSAMDTLGPRSGWDELSEKATARHVLDIAIAHLYLNAKIAKLILEKREKVVRTRGRGVDDLALIETYKKIDKHSRELAHPAMQTVLGGKNISPAITSELRGMRNNLEQIRTTVMKHAVLPAEHKRCLQAISQNDKYFERMKEKTGLTSEILNEMVKTQIYTMMNKIQN